MKNTPRKCPVCKELLAGSPCINGYIECWSCMNFGFVVFDEGIVRWWVYFSDCGWKIASQKTVPITELYDTAGKLVMSLSEWHPYETGVFIRDINILLDRLLNLKAFS